MHGPMSNVVSEELLFRLHLPLRLAKLNHGCSIASALTRDHEDMSRVAILLNQIDDLRCAMA